MDGFVSSSSTVTVVNSSCSNSSNSLFPISAPVIPIPDKPKFYQVVQLACLPLNIIPVDLKKLTKLDSEFSSQLQATTHAVTPIVCDDMNAQMEACLASKLMEWKGAADNATPVTKVLTHCVASPEKVLESLSSHQEHMRTVLAENEHKIEYIDTQSIH